MHLAFALLLALLLAGCGSGEPAPERGPSSGPRPSAADRAGTVDAGEPPSSASASRRATFYRGRGVVARSGCLACHRIGETGNSGPGPDLTRVGERLPRSAIARTLVNPKPPMPSYRELPRDQRRALVGFLSQLR